ncbi:unnamed protein product [Ilex paraguariensis]|uniref:Wound-responsive family protein n=1 Tax=Ilex paraguariensis TaxID=185542 RepID=A0ABC8S5H0_9AQUA
MDQHAVPKNSKTLVQHPKENLITSVPLLQTVWWNKEGRSVPRRTGLRRVGRRRPSTGWWKKEVFDWMRGLRLDGYLSERERRGSNTPLNPEIRKKQKKTEMSSASRAWVVAGSIGLVEALKDQGFCRWNYTMRSINQYAKSNLRCFSQAKKLSPSSPSSSAVVLRKIREEQANQSEESLKKVMFLSCWGPN